MFSKIGALLKEKKDEFHYINYGKVEVIEGAINYGHWTNKEHQLFEEALKMYGKDWDKI
jgi:hypothetical protein